MYHLLIEINLTTEIKILYSQDRCSLVNHTKNDESTQEEEAFPKRKLCVLKMSIIPQLIFSVI